MLWLQILLRSMGGSIMV